MAVCTIYTELYAAIKTSIISSDDVKIRLRAFKICFYSVVIALQPGRQFINKTLVPYKTKDMKGHKSLTVVSCADFLSLTPTTRTKQRSLNKVVQKSLSLAFVSLVVLATSRHADLTAACTSWLMAASSENVITPPRRTQQKHWNMTLSKRAAIVVSVFPNLDIFLFVCIPNARAWHD